MAERTRPPRRSTVRQTFRSGKEAASEFYTGNEQFFDHVRDPHDGLFDWADGIETRVGGATRRLTQTRAGLRILGAPHAELSIKRALGYLFGRTKSRRWDEVDWEAVAELGHALEPYLEHPSEGTPYQTGLYWRPDASVTTLGPGLGDLPPEARDALLQRHTEAEVRDALEALKDTYAQTSTCIPAELRAIAHRRIQQWEQWAKDTSKIPEYACEPDPQSGGHTCHYPSILGELTELRDACRESYDPDWSTPESRQGAPGFPDTSEGPPDPRPGEPLPDAPPFLPSLAAEPEEDPEGPPPPELQEPPPEAYPQRTLADDLRLLADDGRAFGGSEDAVVQRLEGEYGVLYQQEYRQCGRCSCMVDFPKNAHGPYWYGYWRDAAGRRRSKYLGRELRELSPEELAPRS